LSECLGAPNKNATMSLLSNQLPLEHGWFGWSMHINEINQNIDIFLNCDSATGEPVKYSYSPLGKIAYYFDQAISFIFILLHFFFS